MQKTPTPIFGVLKKTTVAIYFNFQFLDPAQTQRTTCQPVDYAVGSIDSIAVREVEHALRQLQSTQLVVRAFKLAPSRLCNLIFVNGHEATNALQFAMFWL